MHTRRKYYKVNLSGAQTGLIRDNYVNANAVDALALCILWPLLLTWFNFNPSMDM